MHEVHVLHAFSHRQKLHKEIILHNVFGKHPHKEPHLKILKQLNKPLLQNVYLLSDKHEIQHRFQKKVPDHRSKEQHFFLFLHLHFLKIQISPDHHHGSKTTKVLF